MLEALKIGAADRRAVTADPLHFDAPIERLISKEYAKLRRAEIDPHPNLALSLMPGKRITSGAADMIDRNDIVSSCGKFAAHAFRKSALDLGRRLMVFDDIVMGHSSV